LKVDTINVPEQVMVSVLRT